MMNMGGPGSLDGAEDGVQAFLTRLFSDREIIPLGPLQKWLVRAVARAQRDGLGRAVSGCGQSALSACVCRSYV